MCLFSFHHTVSKPMTENFVLHSHEQYEILYFLRGDCDYVVEGAVYPLSCGDIILVRPGEMHRVFHKSNQTYERIVISIEKKFFNQTKTEQFLNPFIDRNIGTKNKISGTVTNACGINEVYSRLKKYSNDFTQTESPVISAAIVELLYILNNTSIDDAPIQSTMQKVILYINSNYTSDITLSSIADIFFISKAYLAREFKKATGMTVLSYINQKRLFYVKICIHNGDALGVACNKAGFNEYTSFYRTYYKFNGCSPKFGLKQGTVNI